jgi:3-oxoisoapionate kinase
MTHRLFCYYGDDFTGSTDVLESLAANAVSSVLFVDPPDPPLLERFRDCRAVGIAGESRSRGPEWMSEHLPGIFRGLKELGAPICHYKVCSTFDSSPRYGSIGRALEIGQRVFGNPWVPIVAAAPRLGRYLLFGNLFAAGGGAVHRIDRHPTMRCHPVTPMDESDLRLHLARQTDVPIALLDILALGGEDPDGRLAEILAQRPGAVLFDGLDETSLCQTGRLIWNGGAGAPRFAVGSSGLTQALIRHWRATGLIPHDPTPGDLRPVDRLVVVSGSCSPVTEVQIRRAIDAGFHDLRVNLAAPEQMLEAGLAALGQGNSVVLYTALGPGDCAARVDGAALGSGLGHLLRELLLRSGVRRAVVAGGDTSTHSVRQVGIRALTFVAEAAPGAPLCRGHADDAAVDGVELILKGGQAGPENFFDMVLRGQR